MKALIVDDEKHVRDAIRLLVEWERYGIDEVFEAPEGESAARIIEAERPEIIFTDMRMPVMDGVELLEWIHRHRPEAKTIVISGHDDFDYVRHTVKYGGVDYILKPIDEGELNEALAKAVQSWRKENEARLQSRIRTIELNRIKPAYWDKLFSGLIEEAGTYESFAEQFEREFGIRGKPETGRIAVMSVDTLPRFVRGKFGSNLDLLFFSLTNIANEVLQRDRSGYAFRHWNSPHEVVVVCWRMPEALEDRIRGINAGIRFVLGGGLDAGIGTVRPFPGGLKASYREAIAALRQRNLLRTPGRMLHFEAGRTNRFAPLPFDRFESDFRSALLSAREDQILAAVDRWIAAIEPLDSVTAEQMELWNHEYTVFKTRCVGEFLPEGETEAPSRLVPPESDNPIFPLDDGGRLSLRLLRDEVARDLVRLSGMLAKLAQRDRNIIRDIADYIERHYHEEISLRHISDRFFLSREYISRRFKQEFGENISDYIARTRIGKAKQLLLSPNLRIAQIAEIIGYQDEKYFSKVFKKMVGMSPNEYRKKHGHGGE
jgi:two-component system response regulator YesN